MREKPGTRGGPAKMEHLIPIARLCHEANRAYCLALGDTSQLPWDEAQPWQRDSAVKGVEFILGNPEASPAASHESWLEEKRATGWKYGPVKDTEAKTHPCFVPYDELPIEQRAKDYIFGAIVRAYPVATMTEEQIDLADIGRQLLGIIEGFQKHEPSLEGVTQSEILARILNQAFKPTRTDEQIQAAEVLAAE